MNRSAMLAALDQANAELHAAHNHLKATGDAWKAAGDRFRDAGLAVLAIVDDLKGSAE